MDNNTFTADFLIRVGMTDGEARATLINCRDCVDCVRCTDCRDCVDCVDCTDCTDIKK